jgi:peptidyl-prolyl cis-trans isomerase C
VKKTTTISMALAFVATMAMAQSKPAAAPAAATADPVIISAGDCVIKQSEFESALKSLPPEYQQYAQGPGKKQFADDFLRMKMLAAEGMKNGLDKDADVQKQLSLMKENLVANAQLQKIDKSIKVSDEELKKVYDASLKDYEQVKASHILIAFKGSPAAQKDKPELTEEQAKAKAEELRKKIVGGADFAETAKKESDDTDRSDAARWCRSSRPRRSAPSPAT